MKKQAPTPDELSKLRAENKRLKIKLAHVKVPPAKTEHVHVVWRKALIVFLVGLAGALLVTGNIVFWSARTLVETDRYVAVTSSLIKQPEIQTAVAQKTTDAIFNNVDVAQIAQDALPPKADFLAEPLAAQVKTYTQKTLLTVVSSDKFQSVWENANRTAHQRLFSFIKNYEGDGTINLNDVFQKATQNLADTKLSFLAGKNLPSKVGSITIVSAVWLPKAHWLVTNLTLIRILTFTIFAACIAVALALAHDRRRLLTHISLILSGLLLASIIAFRVTREIAVGQVNSTYQEAARVAWTTILRGLFNQSVAIITLLLLIAFAAWVSGGGHRAKQLRAKVDDLLAGKLHQSVFGTKENGFTKFLGAHKNVIRWAVIALGVISLLLATLTAGTILVIAIITLIGLLLIEFLAAPN